METNWESEAKFWQQKYLEHVLHTNQVIVALSRPMLAQAQSDQVAAELASAMKSAAKNGHSKTIATQES